MNQLVLRRPGEQDGPALHRLVRQCPPLDENSRYCNLLHVTHFADTSIVAEDGGRLLGFVTGYRVPRREHVLFVWQVGVSPEGRGRKLAQRMLSTLIERVDDISHLETTVTPGNQASRRVFENVAQTLNAPLERTLHFEEARHFEGVHEDEVLYRIGPFGASPDSITH